MAEEEQQRRDKLDRLRKVRRGHRSVLTKLTREIEGLVEVTEPDPNRVSRLKVIHEQLDGKMKVFGDLDGEIVSLCPEEDIDREIEDSETIIAKIIEAKRKIDFAVKENSHDRERELAPADNSVTRPRLPELTLPKFRGDATSWSGFWDSYKAAVHDNGSISVVDKFNYLSSLLEGPAHRTIQGLTLNERNYDSAVRLLQDRFGKPQVIISAHMEELLKLPACTTERPSSLRFVYDKININVRGLASLGIESERYGSLLIPIIMTKLPQELRLRFARDTDKEVWEIEELMELVRKEVEARETSELIKSNSPKLPVRNQTPSLPSASTLFTSGSSIKCVYCSECHYSASCLKFKTPQECKKILLRSGRCFNCLKTSHKLKECESTKTCRHCNRKHHQSLCERLKLSGSSSRNNAESADSGSNNEATSSTNTSNVTKNQRTILLQTAHAEAFADSSGPTAQVRILLDNGSQLSYVTERLQRQLNLKPTKIEKLHLNTFGSTSYKTQSCAVVRLYIQGHNHGEPVAISALTSPNICSPLPSAITVDRYPHLRDLHLADECSKPKGEIDVLIGSNFYWSVVTSEIVKAEEGPVAVNSKLGWLLSGPIDSSEANSVSHTNVVISGVPTSPTCNSRDDALFNSLRDFWEIESLGIMDVPENTMISNSFVPSISFSDNRYTVNLPWKYDHAEIPEHLVLCESRLRSLLRKLRLKPDLLLEYNEIIRDQLNRGIIEIVGPDQPVTTPQTHCKPTVHYLPHHGVIRQDSQTTKLRIVYDGSARAYGDEHSLNDCLQTGPNYIPKLFDILIQFRWNKIAITADIEKAFLMIGISESDRDCLRFLWVKDPFKVSQEIMHLRFTRLVFGLRPSPAILGEVLLHHIDKYQSRFPDLTRQLRNSFYVDDLVAGASDEESAINFFQTTREIMSAGGMNLRKWKSNSHSVMKKMESVITSPEEQRRTKVDLNMMNIEEEDETYARTVRGHSITAQNQSSKILGVIWDHATDTFKFDLAQLESYTSSMQVCKRSVLRLTAKIFDPLGFISPFVIQLKVLFQSLCEERMEWDAELSGELLLRWKNIMFELNLLDKVQIPRCYFSFRCATKTTQLHGFCDASAQAFAAVIYLRSTDEDGVVEVALVASKTRVSPLKRQTIPRLELLGAVILSRLMNNVVVSLSRSIPTFYWTDSMAALHWIRTIKPWKQYISHRVLEICRLSDREQWQHCPGNLNPADIPSRGMNGGKLATNEMWWNGPSFLKLPKCQWPRADAFPASESTEAEVVKNPVATTHVLLSVNKAKVCLHEVIDCTRFSSFIKVLRVTAYMLRFIKLLQRPRARHHDEAVPIADANQLTGEELRTAEQLWIRSVQTESFAPELSYLKSQEKLARPIRVNQFGLFMDHVNLLRCRGRINNAQLTVASKNPVLLPSNHQWVRLLIQYVHRETKHSGTADTLSTLRENYWILKGRQSVKKIIKSCVICNKLEGLPYSSTVPPDLPYFRTSDDPPFCHTGIDFAGPLYAKGCNGSEKAYICLFTCCSTRAVHLELTPDLSVNSFLLSFRRFVGRRGLPITLVSDNAKTFRTSSKEILKIARSSEVIDYLSSKRVTWKFIVERAPWWGGFYERLVRSVKRNLKKSIGRCSLTYDQLGTLIVEIEGIINSRPLTYLTDDQDGISGSLSPSHLVNGRRLTTISNNEHFEIVSTHQSLTKRLKHHRHLLGQFASQWRRDYLLNLRESHKLKVKKGGQPLINRGDVVILKSDTSKRIFWKLALVDELLMGADGHVRAAIVKVPEPQGGTRLLRRSVKHLFPIEVRLEEPCNDSSHKQSSELKSGVSPGQQQIDRSKQTTELDETVPGRKPRRQAAIAGERKRRSN